MHLHKLMLLVVSVMLATPLWAQGGPQRIVVADGALTEILYALGVEDRIVGVDTTSVYPASAQALPNVGYLRALSAEGILSLQPDLLLTTQDAGPTNVLNQLQQAGLPIALLEVEYSASGTLALIEQVGELVGLPTESAALMQRVHAQISSAAYQLPPETRIMFVLNAGGRGFMVSGQDTRAHALIELVGARNAFTEFPGYKPLTNEAALMAAPDIILVSHAEGALDGVIRHPALALTPAVTKGQVYSVDHTDWLQFGPRLGDSIAGLSALLQATP
ncbi:ABC transporter substrate-binding protein [Salinispirillum sp. LH 10-3-1]|uniref:ABC transporter substrate-binding protein n=1 Tax=Salinispirillum sp. LH 10-3-1 TaxID=2952525 RepID=A0AB38YIN1_9GAMM